MEVVLNGETLNSGATTTNLGSLLDSLHTTFPTGHIVSYLFVDGQEVMQSSAQVVRDMELAGIQEVRIQTTSLKDEIGRAITDLRQFVDEVVPNLEDAAFQVRLGNIGPASDTLSSCFEGLGLALRNMQEIYSALPRIGLVPDDAEIGLFTSLEKADLSTIVGHFQAQNWRDLGEMVRDDLVPVIRDWNPIFTHTAERVTTTPSA